MSHFTSELRLEAGLKRELRTLKPDFLASQFLDSNRLDSGAAIAISGPATPLKSEPVAVQALSAFHETLELTRQFFPGDRVVIVTPRRNLE